MGTMFTVYISKDRSLKKPAIDFEHLENNDKWFACILPKESYDCDESLISRLSLVYGTVVFMGFQSTVDAFQFVFAKDGQISRKLIYGCYQIQDEWEVVEGEAQEWEEEILRNDEFVAEVGLNQFIDAREVCRHIATHFDFPGWQFKKKMPATCRHFSFV